MAIQTNKQENPSSYFKGLNKACVLKDLAHKVNSAKILPQYAFTYGAWKQDKAVIIKSLYKEKFSKKPLIIRSSASGEDAEGESQAGAYTSILNVKSKGEAEDAIEKVFASFGKQVADQDMVFVQPMLEDVAISGVAFTIDPSNSAPYYVIDYAHGEDTAQITSGHMGEGATAYIHHTRLDLAPKELKSVVDVAQELIEITGYNALDLEFGIDKKGQLYLFQLRPLHVKSELALEEQTLVLHHGAALISRLNKKNPYVVGEKTLLGNMPDWNPAEMIGVRPKPLALSLYKEMITDRIWAYQRDKYGYKNLRSSPLLYSIASSPFIDVRTSFYSFIPKMVSERLSSKLVDYYIQKLEKAPELHDKVEFDIVYSCYTPTLPRHIESLKNYGFSDAEISEITVALKQLTNRMTHSETGEWRVDRGKIDILRQRQIKLSAADLEPYDYIFWLTEDCKRYGTLAFAGLARAAFVATQFLNALGEEQILSLSRIEDFWSSLETISARLSNDLKTLDKQTFLERYGHLRPGTYDILSDSYEEAPEKYFDWEHAQAKGPTKTTLPFTLTFSEEKTVQQMLDQHGLQHTPQSLFRFFKAAIEGREYGKFIFSWSIHHILKQIAIFGKDRGFSKEDCAYINFQDLLMHYAYSGSLKDKVSNNIKRGKEEYNVAKQVILPHLIRKEEDIWSFKIETGTPNFITMGKMSGEVFVLTSEHDYPAIKDKIVCIESADPGYDWILAAGIKGFITCYGGANSHMAVRAMELGFPAVIGVGERAFQKWSAAQSLDIDCAEKRVLILS